MRAHGQATSVSSPIPKWEPGAPETAAADAAEMSSAPNFDGLARWYCWMEWASFGPFLWWCRCAFLAELANCRRALVLGDGDGRFTARLLKTNAEAQVDAVDASAAMLRALERRAGTARLRTVCADVRAWRPEHGYDLVATHFFLDCLTTDEVRALARTIQGAIGTGGRWVVSEFAQPAGWYGRLVGRPVVGFLYWAFAWLTGLKVRRLPQHRAALEECGFRLVKQRKWLGGLLVSELWQERAAREPGNEGTRERGAVKTG